MLQTLLIGYTRKHPFDPEKNKRQKALLSKSLGTELSLTKHHQMKMYLIQFLPLQGVFQEEEFCLKQDKMKSSVSFFDNLFLVFKSLENFGL